MLDGSPDPARHRTVVRSCRVSHLLQEVGREAHWHGIAEASATPYGRTLGGLVGRVSVEGEEVGHLVIDLEWFLIVELLRPNRQLLLLADGTDEGPS